MWSSERIKNVTYRLHKWLRAQRIDLVNLPKKLALFSRNSVEKSHPPKNKLLLDPSQTIP